MATTSIQDVSFLSCLDPSKCQGGLATNETISGGVHPYGMALWIPYSVIVPCWYILVISLFIWSRKKSQENQADERAVSLIASDSLVRESPLSLSQPPSAPPTLLKRITAHPATGLLVRFLSCSFVFLNGIWALSREANPLDTALFTDFTTFIIFFFPMTALALLWHRVFPRLAVLAFAARHHSWKYGAFSFLVLKVYPVLSSLLLARASLNWLFPAMAWCSYGIAFCIIAIKYTNVNSPVAAFRVSPLWALPLMIILFIVMFAVQNLYNGLLLFYGDQHWLVFQILPCIFGVASGADGCGIFVVSLFVMAYYFFRTLYFIVASCLGVPHSDTPFYRILYHIPSYAPFNFRNVFSLRALADGCFCCDDTTSDESSNAAQNSSAEGSAAPSVASDNSTPEEAEALQKRQEEEERKKKEEEERKRKEEEEERIEIELANAPLIPEGADCINYRPPSRLELLEYKGFYTMSFLISAPIVGPFIYILTSTLCASGIFWIRHWFGSPKEPEAAASQNEQDEDERTKAEARARTRARRMAKARRRDPALNIDAETHSEFMEEEYGKLKVIHLEEDRGPYARLATALLLPLIPLWLFAFPEGIRLHFD